jgi:hypothetical protein
MLCTSNGVGLGHLSRVMAVARHLEDEFDVVIFTLSAAVSIPVSLGFRTEYLRSHEYSEFDGPQWNALLEQRLEHLADLYEPSILLFDGTHPYAGLCRFLDRNPDLVSVWERRGMWRAGAGESALLRARHFDSIIEPGDYAAEYDVGATVGERADVEPLAPIRFGDDPLPRDEARAALGLAPDEVAALVQLGAGQINDVNSLIRQVVDQLRSANVRVVVAASVLAQSPKVKDDDVIVVQKYPITEFFGAFDLGFFAGGYNSFHEALSLGLPSVFVPNRQTKLDEQSARTRWAHDHGVGLDWSDSDPTMLPGLLERILDGGERASMRAKMSDLPPAAGAQQAAAYMKSLALGR